MNTPVTNINLKEKEKRLNNVQVLTETFSYLKKNISAKNNSQENFDADQM